MHGQQNIKILKYFKKLFNECRKNCAVTCIYSAQKKRQRVTFERAKAKK